MRIAIVTEAQVDPESNELQRHLRFIESLAEEMHCSAQEIAPFYEEVLEGLKANARISDYLPIFVSKRVREILHRQIQPGG